MNNEECKVRPQVVNINRDDPLLFPFSKQENAVAVATISIIHAQICEFLML